MTAVKLGRCNFSLAHEGSHQILKMLYPQDYDANPQIQKIHYYQAIQRDENPLPIGMSW